MTRKEAVNFYKIRSGFAINGINITEMDNISAVLLAFSDDIYQDRDVNGDMSVIEFIGAGRKGNQVMNGVNQMLNEADKPVIVLRKNDEKRYEMLGKYEKMEGYTIERQNRRKVFVFRLVRISF